jgi:hypothetical protein
LAKNVDSAEDVVRYLVARGWTAGRVDRQLGRCHKEDWPGHGAGFADVLAIHPDHPGFLFVQSCMMDKLKEHRDDLNERCRYVMDRCARVGGTTELWGWPKDRSEPRREVLAAPSTWQPIYPKTETT